MTRMKREQLAEVMRRREEILSGKVKAFLPNKL